jgi:dihydroorotate dehydrogenase
VQTANMASLIAQADGRTDKFGKALASSVEVGTVFPSALRSNLEKAGFTVKEDDKSMADYGFASTTVLKRVLIFDGKDNLVAMGAAVDRDEAILAAALGWVRENPQAGVDVTEGIATAPTSPVS